jgi:ech hydrogenase subunit A
MPRLALVMSIGIAGMFVAPFGMLISKWRAMEALIFGSSPLNLLIILCLAWGSATTVFYWMKWLGTMLRAPDPLRKKGFLDEGTSRSENAAEGLIAILALASFIAFPLASGLLAEPWLRSILGGASYSLVGVDLYATLAMVSLTVLLPAGLLALALRKPRRLSSAYMGGRESEAGLTFKGSAGVEKQVELRALYLGALFPERPILRVGIGLGLTLVMALIGTVLA